MNEHVAGAGRPWSSTATTVPRVLLVILFLYLFLVGVVFLEAGIAAMGAGFQAALLREITNPISGLSAGILLTVLVQSSSVSTSAIVGMVGAGTIPIALAVPMIMGANIGTTVTNTLASLGSIRRPEEFRRAFAAATVHDFFNLCAVLIFLPLELLTGFLNASAGALTQAVRGVGFDPGQPGRSPIRAAVRMPVNWLEGMVEPTPPVAGLFLVLGLVLIFAALATITRNMRRLVAERVERAMNRAIGRGGGALGVIVGIVVTIVVQTSSITTSILVPLVAARVLTLANAYPITVGANLGTTLTALIASMAVLHPEGLTIALVHLLFNVSAMLVIFVFPPFRPIPVRLASALADLAVRRRWVVLAYGLSVFVLLPLIGVFLIG